jgi:hypothetical protein
VFWYCPGDRAKPLGTPECALHQRRERGKRPASRLKLAGIRVAEAESAKRDTRLRPRAEARLIVRCGQAFHEESNGAHRKDSSWVVSLQPILIKLPHRGHFHVAADEWARRGSSGTEGIRSCRISARLFERCRLARKPNWRMRTKPCGKTCCTYRRKNSDAESVMRRCLFLSSET